MTPPDARKVEALFLELAELPKEQRRAKLIERCGGDGQLQAKVERLLAADDANADGTLGESLVQFSHDQIPVRIGAYRIQGIAGEGGMGAVYDAVHESTGRRAAVKLVRAGISTTRGRERLRIEAETLGRLNDPCIAQMYDAGAAPINYADGTSPQRPFIAMEFVDGITIIEYAKQNSLTFRQRLDLMERIARAVQHAHQRGVIHRDLKPSNILVTRDGTPKIVDFGIARLIDVTGEGITITGQVLGTVRYMSPEQASGDASKIDTRSDVYSLGAILYELLANRPLIELNTGSTLGSLVQLMNVSPPLLSSIKPEFQGDIEALVHKSIERDPDDRYNSAVALADDLRAYLDGRDILARSPGRAERFIRIVRQNKAVSSAMAIAILAVLIGGGVSIWQARVAVREAKRAQDETVAKTRALEEAQSALDYLTDILASCTPERDGRDARVLDVAVKAAADIQQRFGDQPLVLASVRLALGRTFLSLGKSEAGLKEISAAYDSRAKMLGNEDRLSVEAELALDEAALTVGRGVELGRDYDHPAQWFEQHLGPQARETLRAKMLLADARSQFDRNEEGFALVKSCYETLLRVYGPDDDDTIDAAAALGFWQAGRMGQPRAAVEVLRPVVDAYSKRFGPGSSRTLSAMRLLAGALLQIGRSDESIALLEPKISTFVDVFGETHPELIISMRTLATSYRDAGKCDLAQQYYDRTLTAATKAFSPGDGRIESTRIRMAELWIDQGKVDEAEKLTRDVLKEEMVGEVSGGHFTTTLICQARILLLRHRPADAMMRLEAAMGCTGQFARAEDRNPTWAEIAYWMGLCLKDLNQPGRAQRCFKEADAVLVRSLGTNAILSMRVKQEIASAGQVIEPDNVVLIGFDLPAGNFIWFLRFSQIAQKEGWPETAQFWLKRAQAVSTNPVNLDERWQKELREAQAATQPAK